MGKWAGGNLDEAKPGFKLIHASFKGYGNDYSQKFQSLNL